MHYLVEKTFRKRGFTDDILKKIEDGRHTALDNLQIMCQRLHEIKLAHKHIVLIPDFDFDGISSGSCGYAGFCELGFYFSLYLPNVDRYGFGPEDIDAILLKWPDTKVIMTCDVGITCISAIKYAKSLGLEVLITDHHVGKFDNGADVVIDPAAINSTYSNVFGHSDICGAYVMWSLLVSYAKMYDHSKLNAMERLIVFAGFGTVSDIMPMVCENRVAVKDSLHILQWLMPYDDIINEYATFENYVATPLSGYHDLGDSYQYRSAFYGLQLIMWYFKSEKHLHHKNIDEDFFGFTLAPMFNSIKRMGADINLAFGVFFDKEHAFQYLSELYDLNEKRKKLVDELMVNLSDIPQPFAPFIYLSDASAGVLGLLASKLLKATGLPTIVVNRTPSCDGKLHGSGRSPLNYNFMDAIHRLQISSNLIDIKGHPYAFGATLPANDDLLSCLYMTLYTDTMSIVEEISSTDPLESADFIIGSDSDCDVDFDVFTLDDYLTEIQSFKPFGHGFFRPNIAIKLTKEDMKSCPWFIIGKESQHVKFCQDEGLDIIIWDGAGDTYFCKDGFSALGHLEYTTYEDTQQLCFVVDNLLENEHE